MTMKTRPNLLPSLDPIGGMKGKPLKVFETNKPVKIIQSQTSGISQGESPLDQKLMSPSPLEKDQQQQ